MSPLTADAFGFRAGGLVYSSRSLLLVSDFAAAELASVVSRMVRIGEASREVALGCFEAFDRRVFQAVQMIVTEPGNFAAADTRGADLATFDVRMAACTRTPRLAALPA